MYLYGASGHAKVIIDICKSIGVHVEGLIDDNISVVEMSGYEVIHSLNESTTRIIVSIGNNSIRKKVVDKLHVEFETAISSSAMVSESSQVQEGTVVMQGAIIQAESLIGKHCIINTGASIDHECIIEDYVHISPHATLCGNVTIGEGTWIGAGSTIIQGVKIGKWCVIGAGSVVTKNIPDNTLAIGNRCKIIKTIK